MPKRSDICILLTRKCNFNCGHCYAFAGPSRRESQTKGSIKKIISRIPENVGRINFSGGEVFLREDLLYYALQELQARFSGKKKVVFVSTNGFWARDEKAIRDTLIKLMSYKVTLILLNIIDPYHRKVDRDLEKKAEGILKVRDTMREKHADRLMRDGMDAKKAVKLAEKEIPIIIRLKTGTQKKGFVFPYGRALTDVPPEHWDFKTKCLVVKSGGSADFFEIDVNGDIYDCLWLAPPPIGNILKQDWDEIMKSGRHEKYREGGPGKYAVEMLNMDKNTVRKRIQKIGPCGFCIEIFGKVKYHDENGKVKKATVLDPTFSWKEGDYESLP